MSVVKIQRALLSVSDKTGLEELARELVTHQVELIASGGTASFLRERGFAVTPAEKLTGNPEAFGGRMKTLSFQILSSLLYRRGHEADEQHARELGIAPIDLVVCHLYPFEKVVKQHGELAELIENIDIGGPSMLRAAAKNYASVLVCPRPEFYQEICEELRNQEGQTRLEFRQKMALYTFRHTAKYDAMITQELEERFGDVHRTRLLSTEGAQELRYGENPQQRAYVCATEHRPRPSLALGKTLQGKELSYNNLWDADGALRCVRDLAQVKRQTAGHGVVIVKHANPCGVAWMNDQLSALEAAWASDQVSAFGSIIAFTSPLTREAAAWLSDKFVEVILAPGFSVESREIFAQKKNLRLIEADLTPPTDEWTYRSLDGGALLQTEDPAPLESFEWVGSTTIDEDLVRFGLVVTKHLRSNAIALVENRSGGQALVGAGMGNPNRLISIEQAAAKARENGVSDFSKTLLISDAFFPFRDNIDKATSFGITHFVQPGGSMRDQEVIAALKESGGAMALTGTRHFRH